MRKPLLLLVLIVMLLVGCGPQENKEQLKAINKNLEYSNGVIKKAGNRSFMDIETKVRDPLYGERVNKWLLIMNKIKDSIDSLTGIIESLKDEVLKQSDSLKIEDAAIFSVLQQPEGPGFSLLNKMASFKDRIPVIFNIIDSVDNTSYYTYLKKNIMLLRNTGPLLPGYAENLNGGQRTGYINKWLDKNLRGSSALMTMIILNKLENDLLLQELR